MKNLSKQVLSILSSKERIFIFKCIIMLLIIMGYITYLIPQYDNVYFAALIDKVERLKSIEGPKIVLIGNSNLAFGINSELLEQEMGLPVVNMGLQGGLGNLFHDDMMDYNVCEGDIYVVAHNTYWNSGEMDNYVSGWVTVENHYDLWHLIRPEYYLDMIKSFPTYIKKCIAYRSGYGAEELGDGLYSRKGFNEYGDVAVYREYKGKDDMGMIWACIAAESEMSELNKWNDYLKEKGARMVVAGFPIYYDA